MSASFTELLQPARTMAIAKGGTHRQAQPVTDPQAGSTAIRQERIILPLWAPRSGGDKENHLLRTTMVASTPSLLPRLFCPPHPPPFTHRLSFA
ncbi:MAG: hypothetical protein M3R02_06165 [Chloroflexota bacterium]|nr:hypothetical protein [Chloroflexota bacterium]